MRTGKEAIAQRYAAKTGKSIACARSELESMLDVICDAVVEDGGVIFANRFSLVVKERKERVGANPRTRERTVYPAKKVLSIRAGHYLKQRIQDAN